MISSTLRATVCVDSRGTVSGDVTAGAAVVAAAHSIPSPTACRSTRQVRRSSTCVTLVRQPDSGAMSTRVLAVRADREPLARRDTVALEAVPRADVRDGGVELLCD